MHASLILVIATRTGHAAFQSVCVCALVRACVYACFAHISDCNTNRARGFSMCVCVCALVRACVYACFAHISDCNTNRARGFSKCVCAR